MEDPLRRVLCHQNRCTAIAGVTDDCVLWPLGTIQTPTMTPPRSLRLYSTAGAKPTFQLFGDRRSTAPSLSRPETLVRPQWSASTSNASLDGQGHLQIVARQAPAGLTCYYGECRYTSGKITTRGKSTAVPGRVEARPKGPAGPGPWPWLLDASPTPRDEA